MWEHCYGTYGTMGHVCEHSNYVRHVFEHSNFVAMYASILIMWDMYVAHNVGEHSNYVGHVFEHLILWACIWAF